MQENAEATLANTAEGAGSTAASSATAASPRTASLELVKELPRGSVGIVHQARNPQQNRSVALRKFEVPEWLDDAQDLLKKIVAEAKTAGALEHPNIARLYTCGYKDFTVFMTAEFVEGQTLREVLSKRQLEMPEVLQFARQLGSALDAAHAKGVFHHFLNPANIKVLPDGTLKVLDFGLLRDKNLMTQTPAKKLENEPYLSPEQVKNKPVDRAANIFSAAIILYQLYTGRSPFHGQHLGEVDRSITDVDPHPLGMAHPRVPESISKVVLKALSKNPAERYESGEKFFAALEEAHKAEPVARANVTGSRPAYQGGPGPSASQSMKAMSPSASHSFRPSPSASQSLNAPPPSASQVIKTPAPGTTRVPVPQTVARVPSKSANHWKLVGGVIGGLCLLVGLAMIFQRRPATELPPESATAQQPVDPTAKAAAPFTHENNESASAPQAHAASAPARAARSTRNTPAAATGSAPTAADGQLIVSSVPMGATVEIEGKAGQSWKAPGTIPALAPGIYKVTFSMPGFAPETRSVQVVSGARTPLDVRLSAVKGFITITGTPAGAEVFINGRDTGKVTPVEFMVEPGPQAIALRKAGYLEASTELKVAAGQSVNYAPSLMVAGRTDNIQLVSGGRVGKIFGGSSATGKARIEIKSEPKGAQVTVNGTPLQKTTPLEIQVEPGSYDIVIEKEGYKTVKESAIVGIDDRIKIDRALSH
jgi:serine/threonine protein kinase